MENFGYADELFGFARFPEAVREASRFPIKAGQSEFVPDLDKAYVFRKEHLRIMQFWITGAEKNILLQGDTGSGKTTLIEQVAARVNWPVFTAGCHGGLEFQELVGRVTLQQDGSTGWADGPLIAAMRAGGIFLLDEFNMLKPEVAGGLNTVLQATSYLIPETGELVKAHKDFRIAATGNAVDGVGKGDYRGTQTPNIALLNRFALGIRVHYMTADQEADMIMAKAAGIDPKVAKFLSEVATMARQSHKDGVIKSPISPRETIACGRRITAFSGNLKGQDAYQAQCKNVLTAMEMTFLYRWSPEDRNEFVSAANSVASTLGTPIELQ